MKKNILIQLIIFLLFIPASYIIFTNTAVKENVENKKEKIQDRDGDAENISDMLKWEFKTLRDPSTNRIPVNIRAKELQYAKTLPKRSVNVLAKGPEKTLSRAWASYGPVNQGGRTRALAVDINNPNTLIAGGASGGIWRSTDDGTTWQKTTAPSLMQNITCLVQDTRPGKTNIWYYGTGELGSNLFVQNDFNLFYGNGIYKSTDDGLTWNVLPSTASSSPSAFISPFEIIYNMIIDTTQQNSDILYAACATAIMRSSDGGNNWAAVLSNAGTYTDITETTNGILYATSSNNSNANPGIYRSTDGTTWTNITPSFMPSNYGRIVLASDPSNNNIVYFLANTPGSGKHAATYLNANDSQTLLKYNYISGDGSGSGGSWTDLTANLPDTTNGVAYSSQVSYDMFIKVSPINSNIVYIGGTSIYRSDDAFATKTKIKVIGGYSWTNGILGSSYPNLHPDQHAFVFDYNNPNIAYSGNDGGISRTNDVNADSVIWINLNNGYITTQFRAIAIDPTGHDSTLIDGGMQDNGNMFTDSNNPTAPWPVIPTGGDGGVCQVGNNGQVLYNFSNGDVYKYFSQNDSLKLVTVTPAGAANVMFVAPLMLDPNNPNIMYFAAGNVIWRNSNLSAITSGNSPTSINWKELTNTMVSSANVSALGGTYTSPTTLYYGTDNGKLYKLAGADTSNQAPVDITGSNFPVGGNIYCIAVDPTNPDNVLVVFSNYSAISLFYSNDGGNSWTDVAGNLEQNPDGSGNGPACRWATILPNGNNYTYYVATSVGVFSTNNLNGTSTVWSQEGSQTIGNVWCESIASRMSDQKVVVGTFGNGVYVSQSITGVEDAVKPPTQYALSQNYPNPFNPSTQIDFSLSKSSHVLLNIYDITGRLVKTLVNEVENSGSHKITFDGSRLASGVYFYTLNAGNFTQTKKMILLK